MYNDDDAVAKLDGYVISVVNAATLVGEKTLVRIEKVGRSAAQASLVNPPEGAGSSRTATRARATAPGAGGADAAAGAGAARPPQPESAARLVRVRDRADQVEQRDRRAAALVPLGLDHAGQGVRSRRPQDDVAGRSSPNSALTMRASSAACASVPPSARKLACERGAEPPRASPIISATSSVSRSVNGIDDGHACVVVQTRARRMSDQPPNLAGLRRIGNVGTREPFRRLGPLCAARPDLVEHLGRDQDRAGGLPAAAGRGHPLRRRRAGAARASPPPGGARCAPTRGSPPCSALFPVRARLRARLLGRAVHPVGAGGRAVRRAAALRGAARRGPPARPAAARARDRRRADRDRRPGAGFAESVDLGDAELALAGAAALAVAPLGAAVGNISLKLRAGGARRRRAERLGDARRRPGAAAWSSALGESWGDAAWSGEASARSPTWRWSARRSRSSA